MPGSLTTQGRPGTRSNAPVRVAFHGSRASAPVKYFRGSMAGLLATPVNASRHPRGRHA